MKKALPFIFSASSVFAAHNCAPAPPAPCNTETCDCIYCLGPIKEQGNTPVRPFTCNGDWVISVAPLYWNAHQDGMEYAIDNSVKNPGVFQNIKDLDKILELNNLIDAKYETPDFKWDFGFKVDLGYNTTCDGWDFGVVWTWYRGKANDHIEAEIDDNHTLIPLWSAYPFPFGFITYATDIETHWKLQLNLIDIELGREYWTSKYLSFRPFIGLRIAFIEQNFEIQHKGGSWAEITSDEVPALNDEVDLDNDFKGVGLRAGFDTVWNFGCGWGLYGNLAASIVYGKFSLEHDEEIRRASSPFIKTKILETEESLHASRAMLDFALGIQWASLFCDCQYGFTVQLGFEQHLFFHQNQLWRVNRIGNGLSDPDIIFPNPTGENVFFQRRGTLDTQGWTLKVQFEF